MTPPTAQGGCRCSATRYPGPWPLISDPGQLPLLEQSAHDLVDEDTLRAGLPCEAYSELARWLQTDPGLHPCWREVRFFEVAERLTGPTGFGTLRRRTAPMRWALVLTGCDAGAEALTRLSDYLLVENRRLLDCLMHASGDQAVARLERRTGVPFDDWMVEVEQHAVERYLSESALSGRARRGIDRLFRACAQPLFAWLFSIDPAMSQAIARSRNTGALTFFDLSTRIAVGRRLMDHSRFAPRTSCRR